jgi:hypothetical protein
MTCSVVCGSSPWERQGCGVRGLWYPPWTRCSGDGRYCHGRYVFTQGDLYRRGSVGGVGEIHDTLSWPHHRVHREPRVKSGCLVTAQIPVSLIAQCNRSWMVPAPKIKFDRDSYPTRLPTPIRVETKSIFPTRHFGQPKKKSSVEVCFFCRVLGRPGGRKSRGPPRILTDVPAQKIKFDRDSYPTRQPTPFA